jgi:spore maturation protein CgeB
MKVIFFCSYYDIYLDTFYKKNPGLSKLSYAQQMAALKHDHFGHWASYADEFVKLGVDAELIIPNCKPLQMAWAKENGMKFNEKEWSFSIPLEQVKRSKPDIFYISSMFEYYNEFLDEVKKHVKKIFAWINCVIPGDLRLNNIQLLLTSLPHFVDNFRKAGVASEMMRSAFDAQILTALGPKAKQDIEFSFVGNLTRSHKKRIAHIKELMDKTGLVFFGDGIQCIPDTRNFFQRLTSKNIYQQKQRESVWGLEMYRTLQRSRITFNSHIDVSKNIIGNMRMYEATGVGTLLLSDGKNAPDKNFNDEEVVYYDNINDAIEKVNYYLQHEDERAAIAEKGQKRTLTEYSYENMSRQLIDVFNKYLNIN